MIQLLNKLFGRTIDFMQWDDYKAHIDFIDSFYFSQSVRKHNVKTRG